MKVIVINGSAHTEGCTARALQEVENQLTSSGIEVERINVAVQPVRGCIGCRKCAEIKRCVFDDIVNEVAGKLDEADGLLIGSPVYYAGVNGQLRAFLDRLFYSSSSKSKSMKVGAVVVSSRRAGSTTAYDEIIKYFSIASMPIVTSTYWNEVHGSNAAEVEQDLEGLQTLRNLGRNMAFLMKAIDSNRDSIPALERSERTNFIR
ncbi:MAG: flavodoxin family protein [Paramuribaculum sp.]|nr:flavodoxin family protein [Paramuribaculum sp.]MDE6487935.1 flavodoxin family protein [Paramuribaculum sp.]